MELDLATDTFMGKTMLELVLWRIFSFLLCIVLMCAIIQPWNFPTVIVLYLKNPSWKSTIQFN